MVECTRHISSLARHYRALLRSAARHPDLGVGQKLHATAITSGLLALSAPNSFLRNTVLHLYAACCNSYFARKVFDEIPRSHKDTVDWTTLMTCYTRDGLPRETLNLFITMRSIGVPVDEITLVSFFCACAKLGDEWLGYQGYVCLVKMGFCYNSMKACNAAMSMYAKCGLMREARRVFDEMSERSAVSWTVLLDAVIKWECLESGRRVFDEMPERNEIAWTKMITGYVENGCAGEAFKMLKEMLFDHGLDLNFVTLCSLLSACTRSGDVMMGRWLHLHSVKMMGIQMDVMVATSLIDMYAKCGGIAAACRVFKAMHHRNVAMWNAMLNGLAVHGKGSVVLDMFDQMVMEVNPDDVTFTVLLNACSHSGLVDQGRVFFSNLECRYGIKPSMEHYACMVDLLGRAGHLEEAETIIMGMPMQPNEFVLGSLLGSCIVHRKLELGERVMQELLQIYPQNVEYHVLLSNMYASVGKPEKADSFRGVLKMRGIRRVPGMSSVHFGGKIGRSTAGEKSYPPIRSIPRVGGIEDVKFSNTSYQA
ncbi:pentatricopeptide repeat-containing protein At5g15340, mitochondrial [Coffea arabica]|uniref:Pentatricopeptide repeat-containing protein At5g15340, mitochondrial n=1 Tax=Coffea arabica TaxID=13443 RepID=A0A6P6VTI1_COFAR|nr:pentatricopeptide repeat-containing protein At5g15340, mitochondrial [Coffea arabica]